MKNQADRLLFVVDFAGTSVFAAEGAFAAISGNFDFFRRDGVSFATAPGGGVIRDVLIGAAPPQAIRDWRHAVPAFVAGGAVFAFFHWAQRVPLQLVIVLDAAGLSLFAIAGTQKALDYSIPAFIATLRGTITGVGGTIRDLLLVRVQTILREDVYATAALAGSIVMRQADARLRGGAVNFSLRTWEVFAQGARPD